VLEYALRPGSMEPSAAPWPKIGRLMQRCQRGAGATQVELKALGKAEGPHRSNRERSSYEQCSTQSFSPDVGVSFAWGSGSEHATRKN